MATRNGKNLREFLSKNRNDDRDDEPRGRGRDDDDRDRDDDREPESERRPAARGRGRDDEDDRPSRTRSRDDDRDDEPRGRGRGRDDDDRPRNSRRNHTPKAGRFSGMPSAQERPPQLEEGKHLLRILKTYESDNPNTGSWFQIHLEVLDSDNDKYRAGDKVSLRYHTERKSMQVTGPKITSFVRAACGFKTDDEMRKRVPKMSESRKAGYDVLIDAALGEKDAEDEFGKNPLEGRVIITDATKGKYDDTKGVQYYEFEWAPCDQKQETLGAGEPARSSRRSNDREDEKRPARDRDSDRSGARGGRASESGRGRGRDEERNAEPSRGRDDDDEEDDEDEEREEERPRARSRR